MLSKHKPYVRSIDIANELSFSKPSVSVAMKNLRENGYIHMDDQGHITLTQTGQDIADIPGRGRKNRCGRCLQDRACSQLPEFPGY